MIRLRLLMFAVVPVVAAGGLLLSSAPGHAEAGRDDALGFWPAASDTTTGSPGSGLVAQADPRPRSRQRMPIPPVPPAPPSTPAPPVPPAPPSRVHDRGMSISIHDGKVQIDGIADLVQAQLERVIQVLDNLPDVPPEMRERVKNRVRAVRGKVTARLGRLKSLDLDKIGPEMERMGDEIEREMEGLDKDLSQLGDKFGEKLGKDLGEKLGKDLAKSFSRSHSSNDSDDGDEDSDDGDDEDKAAVALPPLEAADPGDPLAELKKQLTLGQGQKDQLAKLRADSEHKIELAKRELDVMSNRLHDTLGNPSANEADIERQIDQISAKEATIRKARVLAWVRARSLLSQEQRKQVEAAAKKSHQ